MERVKAEASRQHPIKECLVAKSGVEVLTAGGESAWLGPALVALHWVHLHVAFVAEGDWL